MTVKQLLIAFDISKSNIPDDVLNIVVGDKLYDKKYITIKRWFLSHI